MSLLTVRNRSKRFCGLTAVDDVSITVDKGEIYKHLDELDTKVTDAVNRQTDLLMQSSRDYQVAVELSNLNAVGSIGNLLRMQAQRAVYDTMIYLWRDE